MQPRSDAEVVGNYVPSAGRVQARNSTLLKPRAEIRGKSEKALTANEKTILNYRCAVPGNGDSAGNCVHVLHAWLIRRLNPLAREFQGPDQNLCARGKVIC